MSLEMSPAYAGFPGGQSCQAYNESAFRYFLAVDRWRAERSHRSVILVLASLRQGPGRNALLSPTLAAAMFAGLADGVREVDFIGWHREGRIAGAVLAQGAYVPHELRRAVGDKIRAALEKALPANQANHLHVRAVRLGARRER